MIGAEKSGKEIVRLQTNHNPIVVRLETPVNEMHQIRFVIAKAPVTGLSTIFVDTGRA